MSSERYNVLQQKYVGEKKGLEFLFMEEDETTPRDLSGFAAWVSFWHPEAAPHVVRAAVVDGSNGIVTYELRGDEFDAIGEVLSTVTISDPATGSFETSFPIVRTSTRRNPI